MTRRILLTGGGTGGSVTPLLAVADQLRRQDPTIEFLFIGTPNGPEMKLCEAAEIPFQAIPSGKWRRYWSWKNLTDVLNIWRAWRAARRVMRRWPPDVVVAAGSFVAVPVVWAAKRSGSRVLIHQQDVRPGLANRLMAPAADRITVAFEKSAVHFPPQKTQVTGNPVRPEIVDGSIIQARQEFHLPANRPVLLVVGGGTGSQALNQLMSAVAFRLIRDWEIIHITGQRADLPQLQDDRYRQFSFLTGTYSHALAAADVVVTRAGLGAMTDLAALGKPAIFIPMPDTHQIDNAQLISEANAGLVIPQAQLSADRLLQTLEQFRREPELGRQWSTNIRRLHHPEALTVLAKLVLDLASQ